jgi:hypothetical protein
MTTKLERLGALSEQLLGIVDQMVDEVNGDNTLTDDELDEIVGTFARIFAGVMWITNSEDSLPEWSKYLAYCLNEFVMAEDNGILIH